MPVRARLAVAMLSVTVVAGVGLGYPITGFIAQYGGMSAAFWFGAVVSLAALVVAAFVIPSSAGRPRQRLDIAGAALLGAALAGLFLAIAEGGTWGWVSLRLDAVVAASVIVLVGWTLLELRLKHPLIDLRLLRQPAVLTANMTAILAGVGTYLVISLVTRLVQTPISTGYGLGGSVAVAGLVLVPFSAGSVAALAVIPPLIRRASASLALLLGSVTVLLATIMFVSVRASIWQIVVVMGITGIGAGGLFAVMPGMIVDAVPAHETGSATSFNQVIRAVGYALGSALSAVVLEAFTAQGQLLPTNEGYTVAGFVGCGIWLLTAVICVALLRSCGRTTRQAALSSHILRVQTLLAEDDPDAAAEQVEVR